MNRMAKTRIQTRLSLLLSAVLLSVSLVVGIWSSSVWALGSIYLTPASPSVVQGSNVTLGLRISPGTAVTVVQATINFDPSKLQYVGVNAGASPFDTNVQQTVGASSVTIVRAKLDPGGVATDSLIANIIFKALPYSGSSTVTLSGANAAFEGSYTGPGVSGATITFTPGSCPSGQTGTPPNCQTPTPSAGGSTSKPTGSNQQPATTSQPNQSDTEKPEASKLEAPTITAENWQYTIAKISVSTKTSTQVFVQYGLKRDDLKFKTDLSAAGTTHTLMLSRLAPGTDFFYIIVAEEGEATAQTDIHTARTKGLALRVALLDSQLSPITHQAVVIQPLGLSIESDKDGFVSADNLPAGDYTLEFTVDGKTYTQHVNLMSNVEVDGDVQSAAVQTKALVYDGYIAPERTAIPSLVWWLAGAAVVAFGLGGFMAWRSRAHIARFFQNLASSAKGKTPIGATGGPPRDIRSGTSAVPPTHSSQTTPPLSDVSNPDWRNKHGN